VAKAKNYLSISEFADEFDVSEKTIRNWISDGVVRAVRIGPRMIRIEATELDRIVTRVTTNESPVSEAPRRAAWITAVAANA